MLRRTAISAPMLVALAACGGGAVSATGTTRPQVPTTSSSTQPGSRSASLPSTIPPPRCHTSELEASLGTPQAVPNTGMQKAVPLVFTNVSSSACTLDGFPGFTLDGPPPQSAPGMSPYSPVRQVVTPELVTLAPGASAHAVFTFDPGPDLCDQGVAWVPTDVRTIPPDETTVLQVAWTYGSVDDCQA
ncbi:MAG TPA: DUF4232 domain-containing protein, partial [Acidimicrobiales bacterium]|nr:DUF4232 domain-containing protein [Acidimicrobiales bacterium]